jgi:putative peptide zinc metalloprotease protein
MRIRRGRVRRGTGLLLAAALVATMSQVPTTPAGAADNVAVTINTKDGFSVWSFAFKVTRVMQDVVDESNAAAAVSSCTDCQSIAVALQVVLIMGEASVIVPTNLALALNIECTACETLASAYQWVFTTGGPVRFTAEGNRRLAEIRRAFLELLRNAESLTLAEIQAQIAKLAEQLAEVLQTEILPAGQSDSPTAEPAPEPAPSPTSTSSEPGPSPSPSESPSPSPSPS